jgi:hypothetical protein
MSLKNNLNKQFNRQLIRAHANMIYKDDNQGLLKKMENIRNKEKIKKLKKKIQTHRRDIYEKIKDKIDDLSYNDNKDSIEYNVFHPGRKSIKRIQLDELNTFDKLEDFFNNHYENKVNKVFAYLSKKEMYDPIQTKYALKNLYQVYIDLGKIIILLDHISLSKTKKNNSKSRKGYSRSRQ